ncbi:MAG: ABC transporter ATP-binding protein [Clostridiales bacterium]|nr:ABC transporter ATP-binding protein [Clostridiales bacterium]
MKKISIIKELLKTKSTYLIFILILIGMASDLLIPKLLSNIIDNGILNKDLNTIYLSSATILGLALLSIIVSFFSIIFSIKLSFNISTNLGNKTFEKTLFLNFEKLESLATGSLLTRITNDTFKVSNAILNGLIIAIKSPIIIIGSFIFIFNISSNLGILLLLSLPILLICVSIFGIIISPIFDKMQKSFDKLNLILRENLKGIRVIKTYTLENNENSKFKKTNTHLKTNVLKGVIFLNLITPIISIFINLLLFLILLKGGELVSSNILTKGNLIAVLNYIFQIIYGFSLLSLFFFSLMPSLTSIKRIKEVLEINDEYSLNNNNKNCTSEFKNYDIEFKNVNFSYPETSSAVSKVLENISFSLKEGQSLGILGPTGSGKSTLIKLLSNFFSNYSGEILIGNKEIRTYNPNKLFEKICIVEQNTKLIEGTIKSNLLIGNTSATEDEIINALKNAEAYDFISKYKDGIDHEVLVNGNNFSGGQKQRLSIARALLKKSPIIVFDNSTSALDYITESKIQNTIDNLSEKKLTKIIISQRVSSVKNCDNILILKNGKVDCYGNHEYVLNNSDFYKTIYNSQEGGKE